MYHLSFTIYHLPLPMSHKITPFIRCIDTAKEQAEYYCSIFPDAHITKSNPIVTSFELFGQSLATLNG